MFMIVLLFAALATINVLANLINTCHQFNNNNTSQNTQCSQQLMFGVIKITMNKSDVSDKQKESMMYDVIFTDKNLEKKLRKQNALRLGIVDIDTCINKDHYHTRTKVMTLGK